MWVRCMAEELTREQKAEEILDMAVDPVIKRKLEELKGAGSDISLYWTLLEELKVPPYLVKHKLESEYTLWIEEGKPKLGVDDTPMEVKEEMFDDFECDMPYEEEILTDFLPRATEEQLEALFALKEYERSTYIAILELAHYANFPIGYCFAIENIPDKSFIFELGHGLKTRGTIPAPYNEINVKPDS